MDLRLWPGFSTGKRYWKAALPVIGLLALVVILAGRGSADNTVRFDRMEPSGEVGTRTNLAFYFSADVVPQNRVGTTETTDKVKFIPEVPGKIRWETTREFLFLPEAPLRPSTAYTVEFSPDLPSELGKSMIGSRRVQFTTERFRVEDTSFGFVYSTGNEQGLILQARLSFNYPVDLDALRRDLGLCFTDDRVPIGFHLETSNSGRDTVITSAVMQRSNRARRIELSLPEGFLCQGGDIGLEKRLVCTIELSGRRALTVNDLSAYSDAGVNTIEIVFSEPVDPATVKDFISVTPAVDYRLKVSAEVVTLSGDGFKPGATYRIELSKGLPAPNGNPLPRNFSDDATFPDLEPSVNFNAPGRYLSRNGYLNLGLETVNLSQIELEFARIYPNNIASYLGRLNGEGRCYSYDLERLGTIEGRRTINVSGQTNEIVTTPVNMEEFISDGRRGVFQITACDPDSRWRSAAKVAVVTDLGIMAKFGQDELVVWVNSLDTLAPISGARISLVSFNNQEIASGETDADGVARFEGLRSRIGDFRSYMILAETEDDLSFVCLDDGLIDRTDFSVDGRPPLSDGYEAFIYTDRGVFRPGEKVNLTAVVRGPDASVPPEFPVRLEVVGPDGMVFKELTGNTGQSGVCEFNLETPDYARTGQYRALLYAGGKSVGSTSFSVEEFMPDRIKVETATDKETYTRGDTAVVDVRGTNLYGPPAAGRRVDLAVRLEPAPFSPANYRSYTFGDPSKQGRVVEEELGQGELDSQGQAEFTYEFPADLNPPAAVRAVFQATVTEEGGRAVSDYATAEYHAQDAYIGLRRDGEYAKVGEEYPLDLVELDRDGNLVGDALLEVELYSVRWNSIYRRDSEGHYTYQSEREEERVATDSLRLEDGKGTYLHRPSDWGCYKLVFTDGETGAVSSCEFYVSGWGYAPWAMDHPDRIELDLDKAIYQEGDRAVLQIRAPFAGRALVTVEREKIYDVQVVELKENTGVVTIPVKPGYLPNVYVSVHLIRTIKDLDKLAPARAFGVVPLSVDTGSRRVDVSIDAPAEIRPNQKLEVELTAAGGGGETYLTLAAVDEGICQLTGFTSPDPMAFFYGRRALDINTYDLYGMLLPEVEPIDSPSSPGGGLDEETMQRRNLNPVAVQRVKPVSLWSGLVKPDADGKADVVLDIPQFNGTLRLMAVAVSGSNFGSAAKQILVRDPVVMTSTYPRFLAPGDRAVVPVSVLNGTGGRGVFRVSMSVDGPVKIDGDDWKELILDDQQEKAVHFAVIAGESAGECRFTLETEGNGVQTREETELAVRPPQPFTTVAEAGSIEPGSTLELDLSGDWLGGTGEYSLCLAPLPDLEFAGGLRYLLEYPYGCIEQTVSKVFPLLYFADLARAVEPDLSVGGRADQLVRQGIEKIQSMQLKSGGFSYWPGYDYPSEWGSLYAADFLVEARKAGYAVSDRTYDSMLTYVGQISRRSVEGAYSLQRRVYALYILSLAGKPQISSMAYIKGQCLDQLYPSSLAQLAAAYFHAGDKKTALDLLPVTFAAPPPEREKGGNLNSPVRSEAIILGVLAEIEPSHPAVPKIMEDLGKSIRISRWGTTQENALALMALGKLYRGASQDGYEGEVLLDGEAIASFDDGAPCRIDGEQLIQGKVTVNVSGAGTCYYYAQSSGVPLKPVSAADKGLAVRREFFNTAGQRIDPDQVHQGDLVIIKISVTPKEEDMSNVVITDLLPAGLEIENPRLATSASFGWMSGNSFTPSYMDIRDDRLLLFTDFYGTGTCCFYYAARAVSRGTFTVPPIKAECMYEPEVYSVWGGGWMAVTE